MLLYLFRHGETDYNAQGRMQGQLDVPLNADGIAQAVALAQRLRNAPLTHIYTSPLSRAADTAKRLADLRNMPVLADDRLLEYDMGDWQGMLISEARAQPADGDGGVSLEVPGGETAAQMHARVASFLDDLLVRHTGDARIAISSHGGTLAAMVGVVLGLPVRRRQPFSFGNVSLSVIQHEHSRVHPHWKVLTLNDVSHIVSLP
jgi:broad specificity phosphatase PhoE